MLLGIINSSSMSAFHIQLGALDGELIAVDGFEIEPVRGREFPVAVAQRLDIRLSLPPGPGGYPILAQLEGERSRTGIVLVAGGALVARIADAADAPSPALTLDLERALRAKKPLPRRKADRVHTLNLTGQMAGYVWSINGVPWNKDVPPLPVAEGERVELVVVNRTPTPHPMHLHGLEFEVVEIDGERFAGAAGRCGVRRGESRLVGAPLPPALPPRRGHVHHDQICLTRNSPDWFSWPATATRRIAFSVLSRFRAISVASGAISESVGATAKWRREVAGRTSSTTP